MTVFEYLEELAGVKARTLVENEQVAVLELGAVYATITEGSVKFTHKINEDLYIGGLVVPSSSKEEIKAAYVTLLTYVHQALASPKVD